MEESSGGCLAWNPHRVGGHSCTHRGVLDPEWVAARGRGIGESTNCAVWRIAVAATWCRVLEEG